MALIWVTRLFTVPVDRDHPHGVSERRELINSNNIHKMYRDGYTTFVEFINGASRIAIKEFATTVEEAIVFEERRIREKPDES